MSSFCPLTITVNRYQICRKRFFILANVKCLVENRDKKPYVMRTYIFILKSLVRLIDGICNVYGFDSYSGIFRCTKVQLAASKRQVLDCTKIKELLYVSFISTQKEFFCPYICFFKVCLLFGTMVERGPTNF